MRVLIGITKSNFGGAQHYVFDLALASKEAGREVGVMCGGDGELVQRLKENNIRTLTLPLLERDINILKDYRNFFDLYHLLKHEKPDVLHLNSSKMGGLGALAGNLVGIKKIIFTAHGFEFNSPRPAYQKVIFKIFYWFIFMLSDKIICVSEKIRKDLRGWPFIQGKLVVIHNGIEPFPLLAREEARQKLLPKIKPEVLLIGTLAELHKVKGLDIAIEALALSFKNTQTQFAIIGAGEEEKSLKSLTQKLNVETQIHFLGFVKDARSLLSGLDIFILPSRSEGLPYALLEAGFAKTAVIASRVGGIPEVIEDNKSGLLVNPANPERLSQALKILSVDKSKREQLSQALHEKVLNDYEAKTLLAQTIALYN